MFTHFYHNLLRRYHLAFGSLFNRIVLSRTDTSGNEVQRLTVPLEYAAREAWLTRLRQDPDLGQRPVQIVLPRLAYEMTALRYDPARKLNTLNQRVVATEAGQNKMYMGAPYIINFGLYAYTRTIEDMNQIVEQIVPYFTPDYALTVKTVPDMGVLDRCRIIMDAGSPSWSDSYESAGLQDTREIITTFNFSMIASFYGPATEAAVIRKVLVDMYTLEAQDTMEVTTKVDTEALEPFLLEDESGRVITETSDNTSGTAARVVRIEVVPDPLDIEPEEPFDTATTITDYVDGRQSNPFTGEDVDIDVERE